MIFRNMKSFKEDDERNKDDDDIYDADFHTIDPFEHDIDDRPDLSKELDKTGSVLVRIVKLAVGVSLVFGALSLLPGVFKFFYLLGKEFFQWVDKLF